MKEVVIESKGTVMTRIVINTALRDQLQAITQPVELCDEAGQVLGRFLPSVDPSPYEFVDLPISDEELIRLSRSKERTYTTAEVLAYLEKL
jgi:hypothetical protein